MTLSAQDITIAVTVYNRREFVLKAIQSALDQTVPVKVMVVEDCGPDPNLRDFILKEFGGRIDYVRNAKNRGLFDNWNACVEHCRTSWLSILHDDDMLRRNSIATMLDLARSAPGHALYHGQSAIIDENGKIVSTPSFSWENGWREVDLLELADQDFILMFAGHLFSVAVAKQIGGFRPNSFYTGDWDFWFRMALYGGAAQTAAVVAEVRTHLGVERGSTRVDRMGWRWALENVQRKRNLALLSREKQIQLPFDRTKHLETRPISSRILLRNAASYSDRILKYNAWLFTHSKAPDFRYAILQWIIQISRHRMLRTFSALSGFR